MLEGEVTTAQSKGRPALPHSGSKAHFLLRHEKELQAQENKDAKKF